MTTHVTDHGFVRGRWAAVGAAIAVSLGAGGIGLAQASTPAPVDVTVTISPERILDTRADLGLVGPFAPNAPRDVQVTGAVEVAADSGTTTKTVVPDGASAVLVNVTVTEPTDVGFLTLRPAGATGLPATSTVNFAAGATEPNAATVALSGDGKLQVWVFMPTNPSTAEVLIDVVGYTIGHHHDDRYYTEGEIDTKLDAKANTSDVYAKTQVDAAVASKADSADVYTKSQVDAALAGLPFALSNNSQVTDVDDTGESVVSIEVTAPVDGNVTVITSALVGIDETAGNAVACYINDASARDYTYEQRWESAGTGGDRGSLSGNRMFSISADETATYHLFCEHQGEGTVITVWDTAMTAIFTPAP